MKKRLFLLSILSLMCALMPLQRATADVTMAIIGDSYQLFTPTTAGAPKFKVRVTSEAGDSYSSLTPVSVGVGAGTNTKIPGVSVSPATITINGAGTQDLTFTINRFSTEVLDMIENLNTNNQAEDIEFSVKLYDTTKYAADKTIDPEYESGVLMTLYVRKTTVTNPNAEITVPANIQRFPGGAQLRDVTLPIKVKNTSSAAFEVRFRVSNTGTSENIDTNLVFFSPTSVTPQANETATTILRIPTHLLALKSGVYTVTVAVAFANYAPSESAIAFFIIPVHDLVLSGLDGLTRNSTTGDTQDVTYTLRVTNTGSDFDKINFTTSGDIGSATVQPDSVQMFPYNDGDITVTIPRTALAKAGTYSVTVTATSTNDPTITRTVTTTTIITEGPATEADQTKSVGPKTPDPTQPIRPTQPDLSTHQAVFSEIMFASKDGANRLPQWLEVYNNSAATINLRGWKLQWQQLKPVPLNITATFLQDFIIPSQQCRLIVSDLGRHSGGGNLDNDDVYLLVTLLASLVVDDEEGTQAAPAVITTAQADIQNNNRFIAQDGFSLSLLNANDILVDQVGTLQNDKQAWKLHECLIEGVRSSLIRRFDNKVPRSGTERRAWRRAYDTKHLVAGFYYGNPTDLGTPGYRRGKPVPVELSYFSARFDKNSVVINWTTESELNNAGFNILRSTSRTKNFQPINAKLIQGAGTTAERNKYQFIDKTAKPNVAYYYRLEEIDLSGTRAILSTSQVRGIVAPVGKNITTWGTLKDDK